GRRMSGADLILKDPPRQRGPERRRQQRRRILVDRAELVLAAVAALESQRLGLLAPAPLRGTKPAGEAVEIQHLDPDRGGPQRAVMPAEQQRVEAAGPIARPRSDDH